ncbi:hypothetical protein SAMN05428967_4447 [Phyllobacterium sp. YR620]|nr:hypothetical protein SAMN05428967_4447 [Phyllobacterium sp. YR620]
MRSRREALKSLTLGAVLIGQTGTTRQANALALDDECEEYARRLAEAMSRRHGGAWTIEVDHTSRFALIIPVPAGVD